jgi:peptidoglycan/LPS O-acetylase OafA/YrhL
MHQRSDGAMPARPQHFGALDLYRFIAAAGVALLHFALFARYDLTSGFGYAIGDFALFVDFFFILSGFVIGLTYSDSVATFSEVFTFLRRRIARIYPLYLLTLLIFLIPAVLGISRGQIHAIPSIIQDALLVKSWPLRSELPYNFPAWSVSVEWAMYLLFPIIMLLVNRFGLVVLVALIIIGFAGIEYALATGAISPPLWFVHISPLRALPTFSVGILIARTFRLIEIPHALLGGATLFAIVIALMVAHANTYIVLSLMAATIFVTANSYLSETPSILDSRFCLELGNASYSLYMLHAIFLTITVDFLWPHISSGQPTILYGIVVGVVLTVFSVFTFSFFEKPARDFISGRKKLFTFSKKTAGDPSEKRV